MTYELRRSGRRSVAVEVRPDGTLLVRAPRWLSRQEIDRVVASHSGWIADKQAELAAHRARYPEPDACREMELRRLAAERLPPLVTAWSERMGVKPTGLRVTSAQKRYGSCSAKNSLCFSWRLMQYPPEAVEAVVVHELAHIRQKNHGASFYAEIEQYMPDYRQRIQKLK